MRHERVLDKSSYEKVSVSALLTNGSVANMPVGELEQAIAQERGEAFFGPTPAAADVPAVVGVMIAASYAALISAFALATARTAESLFAVTISALFVVAFFTVPRIFLHVEPKATPRTGFDRFMREGIDTLTGHSSGAATLVQMMIVPVLLTFAALAMGIAASIYL